MPAAVAIYRAEVAFSLPHWRCGNPSVLRMRPPALGDRLNKPSQSVASVWGLI